MFRSWLNVIYGATHIIAHGGRADYAVFRLAPQKRFGQLIDPFAVGSAADLRHHGFHDPSQVLNSLGAQLVDTVLNQPANGFFGQRLRKITLQDL